MVEKLSDLDRVIPYCEYIDVPIGICPAPKAIPGVLRSCKPACVDIDAEVWRGGRVHATRLQGYTPRGITTANRVGVDAVCTILVVTPGALAAGILPSKRSAGKIVLEDDRFRWWGRRDGDDQHQDEHDADSGPCDDPRP